MTESKQTRHLACNDRTDTTLSTGRITIQRATRTHPARLPQQSTGSYKMTPFSRAGFEGGLADPSYLYAAGTVLTPYEAYHPPPGWITPHLFPARNNWESTFATVQLPARRYRNTLVMKYISTTSPVLTGHDNNTYSHLHAFETPQIHTLISDRREEKYKIGSSTSPRTVACHRP